MIIIDVLKENVIRAMKDGRKLVVETLRGLISEIQKKQLDNRSSVITNELCVSVIQKALKQRDDSIEAYTKANRMDLADKEKAEKIIIQQYVPEYLNEAETIDKMKEVIATVPDKNFGAIMRIAKEVPNINMSIVASIIKNILKG
jgi:uncharacterized protein